MCVTANWECLSLLWVKDLPVSLRPGYHDMQFNDDDSRGETKCALSNEPIALPNENNLLIAGQAEVSFYRLPKRKNRK